MGSIIVCEREVRLGTARGPPGTVGTLGMLTGRGLGIDGFAWAFWSLAEGVGGTPGSFVLMLAFRPRDEKKPVDDFPNLGEATKRMEDADEREVLVDDWEAAIGDG